VASSANNQYPRSAIDNMMATYSFYIGQLISVEKIIEMYPSLKTEILSAQNMWNIKFRSSAENIISELKSYFDQQGIDIENELISTVKQIDFSKLSYEEAKAAVSTILDRAEGNMPSPFIETLLAFNPTYQARPEKEIIDGYFKEYYTIESSKSQGLSIKIKYPKSWNAENGDRPHVVQKFTCNSANGYVIAMILINKLDGIPPKEDIKALLSEDGLIYQVPEKSKVLSTNTNLTMDNLMAASITFYYEQPQMNFNLGMMCESYILYYKDCQITLMFQTGSTADKYEESDKRFQTYKGLFWQMANNMVILSQYE
jgi:hypothetical protein